MTYTDLLPLLTAIGLPLVVIAVVAYVLLLPDRVERIAGWLWGGVAKLFRKADKSAVAFKGSGRGQRGAGHDA